ncbi:MAG: dihydrolipoamide acetyltransferase family protein [Planctomycetota bacterium]|jgi:pyruvate dehydrogenase E2 component (dihydrolipoamide acetyltransferase)
MAAIKQPADKSHFILPDLGEGVHEAELIRWRVKPGEEVEEHQTLAEMETDKALVEVPSPWPGVIKELKGGEGDIINVGSILVTYEAAAGATTAPAAAAQPAAAAPDGEREDAGTVVGSVGASLSVPERFARRTPDGNGAAAPEGKALATPAVRRLAKEMGVDINRVPGTGRGGRVTASDIQAFAGGAPAIAAAPAVASPAPALPLPAVDGEGVARRIPFRGVRRKIAQALDQSVKTAVHFTVVDEADVTALDRKRREYAAVLGRKLSFLPFIMTAVCRALRHHPSVNAIVDDAGEEILVKGVINLGCAVDTDHGLMVPVIDNADTLSLVQLAEQVSELARACRGRTIDREQLVGGTFTISNVGSYGGRFATPIINYPEVAILGTGRVYEKVLTKDGMFYAGKVLPLSMSCDHRVVDGAEGARFLNTVLRLLEKPETLVGG